MGLERILESKLRDKIKKEGGLCLKWVAPGFTGVPDRIVLLPKGRIYFVEMKAPGKTMNERQRFVANVLRGLGFIVEEINSDEKLTNFLKTYIAAE